MKHAHQAYHIGIFSMQSLVFTSAACQRCHKVYMPIPMAQNCSMLAS